MKIKKIIFTFIGLCIASSFNSVALAQEKVDVQPVAIISAELTENDRKVDLSEYEVGETFYVGGIKARIDKVKEINAEETINVRADYKEVTVEVTYEYVTFDFNPPNSIYYTKKYLFSTYSGWLDFNMSSWVSYGNGSGQGEMTVEYTGKIYKE